MNILFVAHDPGGANMLAPVIELSAELGWKVCAAAAGPACEIWRGCIARVEKMDVQGNGAEATIERQTPDIVVTGTSSRAEIDRAFWRAARRAGVDSAAAVDTWFNFEPRFRRHGERIGEQPDVILVVDGECGQEVLAGGWCRARVEVVGQPHLQHVLQRVRAARAGRRPGRPLSLLLVSENIREDAVSGRVSVDQFAVATRVIAALANRGSVELTVLPHPREDRAMWLQWIASIRSPDGVRLRIAKREEGGELLLTKCDAVVGMHSMMLVEAKLVGIPTIALRLDRLWHRNPMLERLVAPHLVTATDDLESRLVHFLDTLSADGEEPNEAASLFADSDRRLLSVVVESDGQSATGPTGGIRDV